MEIKHLDIWQTQIFKNDKVEGLVINWESNIGFGELSIYIDPDGDHYIDTECMGKDFAKQVLQKWIDTIILNCETDCKEKL